MRAFKKRILFISSGGLSIEFSHYSAVYSYLYSVLDLDINICIDVSDTIRYLFTVDLPLISFNVPHSDYVCVVKKV